MAGGILDLRIRTWTPMDDRDPAIAQIGTLPMIFSAATPFKAAMKAEAWRREEVKKREEQDQRRAEAIEKAKATRARGKKEAADA
jgi:hypothetical protein